MAIYNGGDDNGNNDVINDGNAASALLLSISLSHDNTLRLLHDSTYVEP